MSVLKTIGKGLLYIIGLPFFILVLAVFAVFGLFVLVFMFIKSIVLFFTGRSLDDELPEDRRAREIKEGKVCRTTQTTTTDTATQQTTVTPTPQPVVTPKTTKEVSIEEYVFEEPVAPQETIKKDDPVVQEVVEEEPIIEEEPVKEEPVIEPISEEDSHVEEIGTYNPSTKSSRFIDDVEEEDTDDDGIDIIYGGDDD